MELTPKDKSTIALQLLRYKTEVDNLDMPELSKYLEDLIERIQDA